MKKFFKSALAVSLCLILFTATLAMGVATAAVTVNSGTCGDNLTWTLDDEGTLTISGTGDMDDYERFDEDDEDLDYTQIAVAPWITLCETINKVVIINGVTSIGDWAFYECTSLTSITIPDSVTSIGFATFYGCSSLESITIPEGVTSIGDDAFYGCSSLTSITVDKDNTIYDSRDNCNAIIETATNTLLVGCKNTIIPNSVTSIGNNAFRYCTSLTSITIPNSVRGIGYGAFYECSSLTSITIPEGVTSIDEGVTSIDSCAFAYCSSLECITIPKGVISIGYGAFLGCSSITSIIVDKDNTIYDSRNNCNAIIETATNILIAGCKNTIIPECVTSIDWGVFSGCTSLESITIPDSVIEIGNAAFSGCTGLTGITIPDSVTSIGEAAFSDCISLTSISIPKNLASIKSYTFDGCSNLMNVTFKEDSQLANIDIYAFRDCTNYKSIVLPDSVTFVHGNAFKGCQFESVIMGTGLKYIPLSLVNKNHLKKFVIGDGVTSIDEYAFSWCESLESITIPEGVTSIGGDAFSGCSSLTSITIPEGVTSIGYRAFTYCSSLESITIPEGVTSIREYAFSKCSSLTSVTIPKGVTSIGYGAFSGCSSLSSITVDRDNSVYDSQNNCNAIIETATNTLISGCKSTIIPEGVTSIGDDAFDGCSSLTSITIPEGVTSIGSSAFSGCSSLTSITIPDSVTSIGFATFDDCSSLTSITIPDSVTSIDVLAFSGCSSLTSITIPDSVTSIGYEAFRNCTSLESITIPKGVASIGNGSFAYCSSLSSITVDKDNTIYDSRNNCNAIIKTATNTLISGCKSTIIPEGVTSIGSSAFSGCSSLTSITIPEGVTSIGSSAFSGCSSLTSITIPEGVTSIGSSAFSWCESLTSITISDSVTSIGEYAFSGCSSLTSITIPDSVTSIGEYAFSWCESLTNIIIPDSVTSIGWGAFYGCPKDMVLFGCVGSLAESYASKYDIIFVPIDNVPYVTLHCPVITDNDKFIAYGVANINSTVSVYSNGILLGNAKADAYGKWRGEFKLVSPVNNKSYDIRAEVKIDDKTASFEKTLEYNIDAIYPTKFTLTNSNTTIDCLDARVKNLSVVPSRPFEFEIKTNKTVSSLNVIAIKDGVTKRIKATYNSKENIWLATGFFDDSNHSYVPEKIGIEADGKALDFECATINFLIDPSGYVYEAVKSNRVEGASAIVCYQDGEVFIPWNANKYEQENPQVTDEQGAYHWDVTEGTWRVKVTKAGYEASYSDWMTVPPEYTEVAIPLITTEAPKVESVVREDNVITVIFSQYMDIDSVNIDNISVTANGNNILDSINAVNAEVSGTNENVYYAKTFELIIDKNTGSKYTLTIDDVENYAGINLYEKYVLISEENNTPIEHEHRYDEKLTKAPLCTENGIKTFVCSICSDSYDLIIPALGHKDTNKDGICDTCKEVIDENLANPCKNAKINVASAKTVDYKSIVTIKATATGVPKGYYLAIYVNGKQVAKGTNTEVVYEAGQVKSDINYTVKVIDAKGNVQKDANGKDLTKDGGKITVNSSFFKKLIAFFKGLFGLLPKVEIKP